MKLPTQIKPISRTVAADARQAHEAGAVRPADILDDILRGVSTGSQVVKTLGPLLSLF